MKMPKPNSIMYILKSISKGFSVYFSMLLPVLYAQGVISSFQVGYIGALMIASMVVGAFIVVHKLHQYETKHLLYGASVGIMVFAGLMIIGTYSKSDTILTIAFILCGGTIGILGSAVDTVTAGLTVKGDRYTMVAKIAALSDIVRLTLPIILAVALSLGNLAFSYSAVLVAGVLFIRTAQKVPSNLHSQRPTDQSFSKKLRTNRIFQYFLTVEFLDSFSSSQLFVFLPILFLAKGYSVENSLLMQTAIFLGYMIGRLVVSKLANRYSGESAVAIAEVGMALSIAGLILASPLPLLYILSFLLGVFTRGTSPAIKALTFDSLADNHMKRGVALYIMAGDTGSALAQFTFGVLVAWYGAKTPFMLGALIAVIVAIALVFRPAKLRSQHA